MHEIPGTNALMLKFKKSVSYELNLSNPRHMVFFAIIHRVSPRKQGKSGLDLEAGRKMAADFVRMNGGVLLAEFKEIESGKRDDRAELWKAMN